jgi:hypothetical protein
MSKVYITKASTKLIFKGLKKVQHNVPRDIALNELENDFSGFARLDLEQKGGFARYFNLKEIRMLYKMKMIFKDLPGLIREMNDNRSTIADFIASENYRFAKKVKMPAFHVRKECQWLRSDFKNIELPRSVKDERLREEMKSFILSHETKNFHEINRLFIEKFQITEGVREISLPNSGIESFENMKIVSQVESIFADMHELLYSGVNSTLNRKVNNFVYADS